jgi:hypothetical protein
VSTQATDGGASGPARASPRHPRARARTPHHQHTRALLRPRTSPCCCCCTCPHAYSLCAARWKQALDAGKAPRIYLESTHEKTLQYATLDELKAYAVDLAEAEAAVAELDKLRQQIEKTVKFDDAGSAGTE